jgi:cation diffusion facilitator CzcD-associated flavoprotein CzcO
VVAVAFIGAWPYGLSIAPHLKARAIPFRIFGNAMHTWLAHMPKGMRLISEGFASWLYDPDSKFTLADSALLQTGGDSMCRHRTSSGAEDV